MQGRCREGKVWGQMHLARYDSPQEAVPHGGMNMLKSGMEEGDIDKKNGRRLPICLLLVLL